MNSAIPTVNYAEALEAVLCAVEANEPILLQGDPGVGKSALAREVSKLLDMPLVTLIGSTLDPTDVAGLPGIIDKMVQRIPLAIIRKCADEPCLIFLDEVSCSSPAVQASLLRLVLERIAGDVALHNGTRVISAANPPEQAPGGYELSAPLVGRFCILRLRPSDDEVLKFFSTLGEEGSDLRVLAEDFALTCGFIPQILQVDIPDGCVSGNIPWGAPRAWERALRCLASAERRRASFDVAMSLVSGSVGLDIALTYRANIEIRKHLPTVETVATEPLEAKVPKDLKHQISAIGLIPRVMKINPWAAWIYIERLTPEIATACARLLLNHKDGGIGLPFAKEGIQARGRISSMINQ